MPRRGSDICTGCKALQYINGTLMCVLGKEIALWQPHPTKSKTWIKKEPAQPDHDKGEFVGIRGWKCSDKCRTWGDLEWQSKQLDLFSQSLVPDARYTRKRST